MRDVGEFGEDIGEDERVHEKTFRELKSDALGGGGEDTPNAFVNFEIVV